MNKGIEFYKTYFNFMSALEKEVLGRVKFPNSTLDERLKKFYNRWQDYFDVSYATFRKITTQGLHPIFLKGYLRK
ncbi:MAG: hypothetical protein PVJ67_06330 [Candidatus Pacearchaeota archaeon]|jgi:hypothetical protein